MTTPATPIPPIQPAGQPPPVQPNGQIAPPIQPVAAPLPVAYPPAPAAPIPAAPTGPLGVSVAPPAAQPQIVLPPQQPIPAHEPLDDGDDPGDPLPARARRARPIDENHPQVKKLLRQRLDAQLADLTTQQDRAKLELTEQLKLQLVDAQAAAKAHQEAVAASQQRYALLSAIVASGHQLHPQAAPFVEFQVSAKMQAEGMQATDALAYVLAENPYVVATQAPQVPQVPQQPVPGQPPPFLPPPMPVPVQPQVPQVQAAPGQVMPPGQVPPAPVYQAPVPAQIPQYPQVYAQQAAAAGMQAQTGPGVPQAVQVVPLVSTTPQAAPATQTPVPIGQPAVVDARKMSPQAFAAYRANKYGVA